MVKIKKDDFWAKVAFWQLFPWSRPAPAEITRAEFACRLAIRIIVLISLAIWLIWLIKEDLIPPTLKNNH